MYYDGTIASRLRELQKETNAAYARVNYIHTQLGLAFERIRDLEEENLNLKALLDEGTLTSDYRPKVNIPLIEPDEDSETIISADKPEGYNSDKPKRNKK